MLHRTALLVAFLPALALPARAQEPPPRPVEFNRDVRPILSDSCFQCHGPDKRNRKAGLRLDTEAGAFADLGGYRAIVPGRTDQSELLRRVLHGQESKRMPPASTGPRLTPVQIGLLRRWVEQGAKWEKHWSLLPPRRPALPSVKDRLWPRNGIDQFILARLEKEGLQPSPEADRVTLLRRVTLDLTGLPPTPAEVDAFLADNSPGAYERVVERLLASPRYGERMAIKWLEAARYADTNGYQTDGERIMWRWRDWIIDAFNANMPFDQFTVEQLAGDLLPRPTLEQRIATGFNRNHRGNSEGGVIPEEYAVEYVVDRVDTTFTVWLGLTAGCARCHDHKYDPIAQKEFYQVFAYFNNVPEKGKAIKYGNSPPYIKAPTRAQQTQLRDMRRRLDAAEAELRELQPRLAAAQSAWEKGLRPETHLPWGNVPPRAAEELTLGSPRGLTALYDLDGNTFDWTSPFFKAGSGTCAQSLPLRRGTFRDGGPAYVPGRVGKAVHFDGKRFLDAGDVGDFGFFDRFTLAAWVRPEAGSGTILSRMADTDRAEGYSLRLEGGKLQLNLVKRWLDDAIRVETVRALEPGRWHHVAAAYDGSRVADGIRIYVNGEPQKLKVNLDDLNQSFRTRQPLRVGSGGGPASRFRGAIDEVRIFNRALKAEDVALFATPESVAELAAVPPEKRVPAQARKLRAYFLEAHAPRAIGAAWRRLRGLREESERLDESIPTTMVMEEMRTPRDTHVLLRGEYDKKGPKVAPGLPASLPRLPAGAPNNRLGLARWLVGPSNPLTARVAVNRVWQMYFGAGLVRTTEDFGSQGEWPSHPELLDWLATEFMAPSPPRPPSPTRGEGGESCSPPPTVGEGRGVGGWDFKRLHRLVVTSAAYRQSSRVTRALLQRDPENRLLARGPRLRLSAEMIRDQALAASGLLVERLGGPSVRPYQPPDLWKGLTEDRYTQDHGAALYRRSLYTFWKRTIAPPAMLTFDAAGRETCVVRVSRTNTPLQALNLMNDVTYVEAARVLAERALREGGATADGRLTLAFRLATGRPPRPAELGVLRAGLDEHLAQYRADRRAALKLVSAGESRRDERLDVAELAAYTAVASLILNLDETITKE
jgi:hypothetical protein